MAFIRIQGFTGMVYAPEPGPVIRKNPACADCHSCGFCNDERCTTCLKSRSCNSDPPADTTTDKP